MMVLSTIPLDARLAVPDRRFCPVVGTPLRSELEGRTCGNGEPVQAAALALVKRFGFAIKSNMRGYIACTAG
jgi:hypothetical protein